MYLLREEIERDQENQCWTKWQLLPAYGYRLVAAAVNRLAADLGCYNQLGISDAVARLGPWPWPQLYCV